MGCLCSKDQMGYDFTNFPKVASSTIVDGSQISANDVPSQPLLKEVNFAVISDSDPDVDLDDDEINNILEEDSDD